MCNYCNSFASGCGWNGLWRTGYQRLCRDCNGNIRVNTCNGGCGCGCQNSCGCSNSCCNNHCCNNGCDNSTGNNDNTNGNTGGGFTCVTVCGNRANAATSTGNTSRGCGYTTNANATDYYYARQYGLLPYGGCACGSDYTYDTVTT